MTDQESLQERCIRLGVKPEQLDDAIAYLGQNAVSVHFHKFADDAEVATKLLKFTRPAQSEAPLPDPFRTWLGKLADGFDRMAPVRRMMLHNEYKESLLAKPSAIDTLHAELITRHNGDLEGAHLSPMEKLRIAHTVPGGTNTPKPAPKVAMTPALRALPTAQARIEAIRAIQRVAALRGSNNEFHLREVVQLRARFGAIIPD